MSGRGFLSRHVFVKERSPKLEMLRIREFRRTLRVSSIFFLLLGLLVAGCSSASPPVHQTLNQPEALAKQVPPLPHSEPVSIDIPKLDAHSSLIPLGLDEKGQLLVPPLDKPMQASWYDMSPTPGERGPSVILGHVDGHDKPGIFFKLKDLSKGDEVFVRRQDNQTVRFQIYETQHVSKDSFPTEKVYGDTAGSEVRLITCGGAFDRSAQSYEDNIIAYGRMVGA